MHVSPQESPTPSRAVIHLLTSTGGGAGIAAQRLAAAQARSGRSARLLLRGEDRPHSDFCTTLKFDSVPLSWSQKRQSSALTVINGLLQRRSSVHFTPLSISLRGRLPSELQDTVLHVHNVYNFLKPRDLLELTEHAPVVVTLHDERLLTGGCHYTLGCAKSQTNCTLCPQSRLPGLGIIPAGRTHLAFLQRAQARLFFVAPSRWMYRRALEAGLPEPNVHFIPNPLDIDTFGERSDRESTIPPTKLTIAWQPGKNDKTFADALLLIRSTLPPEMAGQVHIVATSDPSVDLVYPVSVVKVDSEETRSEFWRSATIGVSATAADNFPNVALECMAVGTPFIVPRVGGAHEAVQATGGGVVAESATAPALAKAILSVLLAPETHEALSSRGRAGVSTLYSPEVLLPYFDFVYKQAVLAYVDRR